MVSDPRSVATEFLAELAKGSFEPGLCYPDWADGGALTLGHGWDNRFLSLVNIDVDNRVVQAVQSRMARYASRASPIQLVLNEMDVDSLWRQPERQIGIFTFGILCDGTPDGSIRLRRGDYQVWGRHSGWRVWELTP